MIRIAVPSNLPGGQEAALGQHLRIEAGRLLLHGSERAAHGKLPLCLRGEPGILDINDDAARILEYHRPVCDRRLGIDDNARLVLRAAHAHACDLRQSRAKNGLPFRWLSSCMRWATYSLPVPLAPRISTDIGVGATRRT